MLLSKDEVLVTDNKKIHSIYEQWPEIALNAIKNDIEIDKLRPSMLVLAGMGGSGTTADILADLLYNHIPLYVVKGYDLPAFKSDALVIALSASGNTEETLNITMEANKRGIRLIGISSGGRLEELCNRYNYKHIKIEMRVAPRFSLLDMLFATLKIVSKIESLEWIEKNARDSINVMRDMKKIISINNTDNNISKELALYIDNNLPVIYTSPTCKSVGIRFKNSLNENSKTLAITSDLIEASHNEIVTWAYTRAFKPILIRNARDREEINHRFGLFKVMLSEYNHDYYELPLFSNDKLANMLATIYVLEYATLYLAIHKKLDPFPIDPINRLKDMMKRLEEK